MRIKLVISTLLILSLISCSQEKKSKLLSTKITDSNLIELTQKMENDKDLSINDLKDFKSGFQILGQVKDSLIGKTVGDIIDYSRNIKLTKEANEIKNIANVAMMNYSLTVQAKSINPSDNQTNMFNIASYSIENKTDKEIVEINGFINLNTTDKNELVKRLPLNLNAKNLQGKTFKAGTTEQINYPYNHDPKNQRDNYIRQAPNNLRAFWFPEKIVFSDGTTLEAKYNK